MKRHRLQVQDYAVGWISALPLELEAAKIMLDEEHDNDQNTAQYILGRIGQHNVVMTSLPKGQIGTNAAAVVATRMQSDFPSLQFGVMVGIGGGVPTLDNDIRLGDVVIGSPSGSFGGVVQHDFGKVLQGGVQTRTGFLNAPPTALLTALALLQADQNAPSRITSKSQALNIPNKFRRDNAGSDDLYQAPYNHIEGLTCSRCSKDMLVDRPQRQNEQISVHYGTIASGNQVIKDGVTRDRLSLELGGILCFEMEAAGLTNSFPCLVVRGICDYSDSHKNKSWQPFAALTAAVCTKEILSLVSTRPHLNNPRPVLDRAVTEDGNRSHVLSAWRLTDPRDERKRIESEKNSLLEGSCAWVFSDLDFIRWWNEDDCRILCIHGDPGKGKTMMAMAIIDELSQRLALRLDSGILAYFFCQNRSADLNSANTIVRGLAFHLAAQDDRLIRYLQKKYEEAGNKLFEGPSNLYSMWNTLVELLQDTAANRYYIVIDALDECDADSMEKFLHLLMDAASRLSSVKWIVTTRNEQRILEHLKYRQHSAAIDLGLNLRNVAYAVQLFIDMKVNILRQRKTYDSELFAYIKNYLEENADGTFLWVSLVCKELDKYRAGKARGICSQFPKGLVALYGRMLDQIDQHHEGEELKQLLRTVTIACRPLNLSELEVIAGLSGDLPSQDHDWQNARDLAASCGSFLMVSEGRVEFIHKSAKDYFTNGEGSRIFPTNQSCEHHALSSRLLRIMSKSLKKDICNINDVGTTTEQVDKSAIYKHIPLYLQYACRFWVEHVCMGQTQIEDDGEAHEFLRKKFLYWLEVLSIIARLGNAISMLADLHKLLKITRVEAGNTLLLAMVYDAWRFVRSFRSVIEEAPLQIYHSALLFSPKHSIIRCTFREDLPRSMHVKSGIMQDWSPCLQVLETPENTKHLIITVILSPDGARIAGTSLDGVIHLWDMSTGLLQSTIRSNGNGLNIAFTADGSRLVSVSRDGMIQTWDTATGRMLHSFQCHTNYAIKQALSQDGSLLACHIGIGTVQIWDTITGLQLHTFENHTDRVSALTFSRNGSLLASGSVDKTIRIWDLSTGAQVYYLRDHLVYAKDIAFSPNLTCLVFRDSNNCGLWMVELATGALLSLFNDPTDFISSIAFSEDGLYLVTDTSSGTLRIWNTATRTQCCMLKSYLNHVSSIIFSPDGAQLILASGSSATVQIWDLSLTISSCTAIGHTRRINCITFSPNMMWLASASGDSAMIIWERRTGELLQVLKFHEGSVTSVNFSLDSSQLASCSLDGKICIWDTKTWSILSILYGHNGVIWTVVFSPCGSQLASSSMDGTIRIWNLAAGSCSKILNTDRDAFNIAFSPDGSSWLASTQAGKIHIWDVKKAVLHKSHHGFQEELVTTRLFSDKPFAVTFSPDGLQLAVTSKDLLTTNQTVQIRDTLTGALLQSYEGYAISEITDVWKAYRANDDEALSQQSPFAVAASDRWIKVKGRNVLRLPYEYTTDIGAVQGGTIALGCSSGRVVILEFDI